jgi:hypothetical protein
MPIVFYDGCYFLAGAGGFLFSKTVRTGFGALPACLSAGTFVKRPGHHVYHSPAPSAEVKNKWRRTSAPTICLYGVGRNNFALYCVPIFLVFSSPWPCNSIALFLEVGLLTAEQSKVQPKERGSVPYLHFSAKIAVFSKLPLRRLSHIKPRPQKRIYKQKRCPWEFIE